MAFKPGRYLIFYLIATIAMAIGLIAFKSLTGISLGNAGMSLLPFGVAAALEGQRWTRGNPTNPSNAVLWQTAFAMVAAGLAGSVLLAAPFLARAPEAVFAALGAISVAHWALFLIAALVLSRVFWGVGNKSERRSQSR